MIFQADIVIPKNTIEIAPTIVYCKIAKGIITKFMVRPRAGHASLAHCVISYHNVQIAPSTRGMDLNGDNFPIDWEEYYSINQPPFELEIRGWNEDDTYPHTFTIYTVILPRKAVAALAIGDTPKATSLVDVVKNVFRGGF